MDIDQLLWIDDYLHGYLVFIYSDRVLSGLKCLLSGIGHFPSEFQVMNSLRLQVVSSSSVRLAYMKKFDGYWSTIVDWRLLTWILSFHLQWQGFVWSEMFT